MAAEFITLSDSSFRILLQKFVEEIAELKSAIQAEPQTSELRLQLEEAVTQSVELHEELKQVHRMYQQAQAEKRRLSDDEMNALRYFGFATPPDGVIASETRSEGPLIALPPRRALSSHREPSVEDETETDVIDILDTMRHMQRSVASPSDDESRRSLGRDAVTPRPAAPRQAATPVALMGASVERAPASGTTAATPASVELDFREQRLSWEEKILRLERELLNAKAALLDQREEARQANAAREKAAAEAVQDWDEQRRALERKLKEWETRCDALHTEFQKELVVERERGLLKDKELDMCKAELHRASLAQEDLWREVAAAKQSALAESLGQLTEAAKLLTATDRAVLLDDRARLAEIAREIDVELRGALQRRNGAPVATASRDSMRSLVDTYDTIRQGEVVAYSLGGVSDLDAVDAAVLDTLHRLKFPFVIALRRLGPGDYFIDRRLHVRLTNGEVTVQTFSTDGVREKSSLVTLIQYLLHLYAPLLPPRTGSDDASTWGYPANDAVSKTGHDDVTFLTQREAALRSAVLAHRELLSVHNSQKVAELSPSPSDRPLAPPAPTRSSKWLRPPSPSPVSAFQEGPIAAAHSEQTNERLKQAQRELMERFSASTSKRRPAREGNGPAGEGPAALPSRKPLDLSQLSSEELEQLKRAALAQQVREMKRLGSHPKSVR